MLKQVMKISSELTQKHTLSQDSIDYDHYNYVDLGYVCKGINNDEGYSKIKIELGRDPIKPSPEPYTVLKMTHDYYYTYSQTAHSTEIEYFSWSVDLYDYIKNYIKLKKGA